MTVTCLTGGSGWASEHDEAVLELRGQLLADLAEGLDTVQRAADALDRLRSSEVEDVALAQGRDGRDIACHIDGSIRGLRAAYAVAQVLFSQEWPR